MSSEVHTANPPAVGILRPEINDALVRRDRLIPHDGLSTWVEHYWTVAWELDGPGFVSEVVSHPSVHVTVESGDRPRFGYPMPAGLVHGVITRRFSQEIAGRGRVFGVKFRPGGFGAFTGADVGTWTDRVLPLSAAFGDSSAALVRDVLEAGPDDDRASLMDAFLLDRVPARDKRYDEVLAIVRDIQGDPTLTTVELAARRHAMSERTLQRLFRRYVGVGPKWVLQRARLHDAVDRIDSGRVTDLASLALELGWFDQAHFTRDFTALVGQSPAAYAARR
ncbi:MAG TPA: helix-turn-helix domain-containing protein [Nocardioides sp.]|uniref:helix-turn-helix domain-containing protein n=1 Tax=Nocardioides sp. TaxID=35761 RepID=UPI002E2EB711|nr:helix-turn-helix domain-containing protein [Nocardioides sp.]HEX5090420.1 helix-turn-helix domain-containing protein [Nocardioides sp.]